jgi:triosephosphate isomerase
LSAAPTDRRPLLIGNWKMNLAPRAAAAYMHALTQAVVAPDGVDVAVAPAYPALATVAAELPSSWGLVAQDVHWDDSGPFTGEVSAPMLKELGVTATLIGHSERRTLFGETDFTVNRKAAAAFAAGLTPIACIGETLDERERNETFDVLDRQITRGLDGLTGEQIAQLVIAYEPVWAIGTGRNATPAQAAEAHGHIRSRVRQWFGAEAAGLCHVIYGGSVKPDNIRDLVKQPDVDGALVGGASLDVRGFFEIVTRSRPAAV